MLASARRLSPELDLRLADACALPFDRDGFDAVTCGLSLSHFIDREQALREILRVLRPGGIFVASSWGEGSSFPTGAVGELLDRCGAPAPSEVLDERTWLSPKRGSSVLRDARFAGVSARSESFTGSFSDVDHALAWSLGWPLTASRLEQLDPPRRQRFLREVRRALAGGDLFWRFAFNFYLASKPPAE